MKSIIKKVTSTMVAISMSLALTATPAYAAGSSKMGSKQARDTAALVLQNITNDSMSDVEKITAVHDYMVIHTAYDIAAYKTKTSAIGKNTYHADGPILYGTGVCQGYSEAFKLYMDLLGIPCIVVSNTNHAWNRVTLNGVNYDIDVTWDDPIQDNDPIDPSQVEHMYLLLSPEEMSVLHTDEGRFAYYANIYGAENISTSVDPLTGKTQLTIYIKE